MGDTRRVADAYHVFGLVHATKGSLHDAKLFFNESLRLNEQEENFELIGEICESYANLYKKNDDIENAKKYLEKAVETYQKLNLQVKVKKLIGLIDELDMDSEDETSVVNVVDDDLRLRQAKKAVRR